MCRTSFRLQMGRALPRTWRRSSIRCLTLRKVRFFVDLQGINATQKSLQDQIDNFEVYVASQQVMLTNQYNQVNVMLQQLPLIQKQTESQLSGLINLNSSK